MSREDHAPSSFLSGSISDRLRTLFICGFVEGICREILHQSQPDGTLHPRPAACCPRERQPERTP
jgi:hypothetical protein